MSQHSIDDSSSSNSNFPTLQRSNVHIKAEEHIKTEDIKGDNLSKQGDNDKTDTKVGDLKTSKSKEDTSVDKKNDDDAPTAEKDTVQSAASIEENDVLVDEIEGSILEQVNAVSTSSGQGKAEGEATNSLPDPIQETSPVPDPSQGEEDTKSPSQSLLQSSALDDESVDSNVKRKGRPR